MHIKQGRQMGRRASCGAAGLPDPAMPEARAGRGLPGYLSHGVPFTLLSLTQLDGHCCLQPKESRLTDTLCAFSPKPDISPLFCPRGVVVLRPVNQVTDSEANHTRDARAHSAFAGHMPPIPRVARGF